MVKWITWLSWNFRIHLGRVQLPHWDRWEGCCDFRFDLRRLILHLQPFKLAQAKLQILNNSSSLSGQLGQEEGIGDTNHERGWEDLQGKEHREFESGHKNRNIAMQSLIKKSGFTHVGVIFLTEDKKYDIFEKVIELDPKGNHVFT